MAESALARLLGGSAASPRCARFRSDAGIGAASLLRHRDILPAMDERHKEDEKVLVVVTVLVEAPEKKIRCTHSLSRARKRTSKSWRFKSLDI